MKRQWRNAGGSIGRAVWTKPWSHVSHHMTWIRFIMIYFQQFLVSAQSQPSYLVVFRVSAVHRLPSNKHTRQTFGEGKEFPSYVLVETKSDVKPDPYVMIKCCMLYLTSWDENGLKYRSNIENQLIMTYCFTWKNTFFWNYVFFATVNVICYFPTSQ